jgi:flagellar secretion chaperone FliS
MNPYSQSANTYKNQQVHTASQEELLILLYDGAIRFLNQAKVALETQELEKYHTNIVKTQRIITEFMSTLDVEVGGDMAKNLMKLYDYMHFQLVQANMKKDVVVIDEVLGHLRGLKETWEEAIKLSKREEASEKAALSSGEARVYSV